MTDRPDDLGVVTVGAREIYDELVAMRTDVRDSLRTHQVVDKTLTDHEDRLRTLERWKYSIPVALVTAVISAGVTLYTKTGA